MNDAVAQPAKELVLPLDPLSISCLDLFQNLMVKKEWQKETKGNVHNTKI